MTILMDDPSTDLVRDMENVAIMLARNVATAMDQARHYGVSIQVNHPSGDGIRVVTTHADAVNVKATYPANTPWCVATHDGWEMRALAVLVNYFGPPKTVADALAVKNEGIAWSPEMMRRV